MSMPLGCHQSVTASGGENCVGGVHFMLESGDSCSIIEMSSMLGTWMFLSSEILDLMNTK